MKNRIVLITLIAILLVLFGCAQNSNPTGLIGLGNDKNNTSIDSNVNVFNNLDEFRKVKVGDNISVDYIGRLSDGTIFDTSIGSTPYTFVVGVGKNLKAFDDAIIGMKVGETKSIVIPSGEGYVYNPSQVYTFDRNMFTSGGLENIQVGVELTMQDSYDSKHNGTVIAVNDNNVVIDFNNKLVGKELLFEITLISINN